MYKVQPMCENVVISDLPTSMYKVQSFYESIGEVIVCLYFLFLRSRMFTRLFFLITLSKAISKL